jgi:hypothetical protein
MSLCFEKHENTLTRITKVISMILGIFLIFYGGVASLFGVGPGGKIDLQMRLLGMLMVLIGGIYILPNSYIIKIKIVFFTAVTIVILSSTMMLFKMMLDDLSAIAGFVVYGSTILISIVSVISYWGYQKTANK